MLRYICYLTLIVTIISTYTQGFENDIEILDIRSLSSAFPCPNSVDIDPCVCGYTTSNEGLRLYLDCSDIQSVSQLEKLFQNDVFPISEFWQFYVSGNENITHLDKNIFNNVTFHEIYLYYVPNLIDLTDSFLIGCVNVLEKIYFY